MWVGQILRHGRHIIFARWKPILRHNLDEMCYGGWANYVLIRWGKILPLALHIVRPFFLGERDKSHLQYPSSRACRFVKPSRFLKKCFIRNQLQKSGRNQTIWISNFFLPNSYFSHMYIVFKVRRARRKVLLLNFYDWFENRILRKWTIIKRVFVSKSENGSSISLNLVSGYLLPCTDVYSKIILKKLTWIQYTSQTNAWKSRYSLEKKGLIFRSHSKHMKKDATFRTRWRRVRYVASEFICSCDCITIIEVEV